MRLDDQLVTDRPAGYTLNGGQHVVYRGSDSHIRELYWNGDLWVHTDLTVGSGADRVAGASAIGHPFGYTLSSSQHVVYRGSDGHIYELYWEGAAWGYNDLTVASGAGNTAGTAAAGDPAGYTLSNTQHVVYRGSDGHIHELYWTGGPWGHNDLTVASGATNTSGTEAAGDPAGYTLNDSQHVVYRGNDGHLYELYWGGGPWGHNDLTVASGASKLSGTTAAGNPSGYTLGSSQHVVYRGSDGHIHELYWEGGPWAHNDLTVASGVAKSPGTAAAGDPDGYSLNNSQHVVFRGSDGDIHEFYSGDGPWGHNDLTVASGAAKIFGTPAISNPAGYALKDSQHVVYRGSDGHIHELYWEGGPWAHHDLTLAAGAFEQRAEPAINAEVFDEYDMVVCITETVINQQLARLVQIGVIDPKLIIVRETDEQDNYVFRRVKSAGDIPKDSKGNPSVACLDTEFLPQINISQSGTTITLVLNFQSGTANLSIPGSPRFQKYDVTGWRYGLSITLDLKAVEKDDIGKNIKVPDLVASQLNRFLDNDFEISHLFLDLNSVDLLTFDSANTSTGDAGSNGSKQLAAFMQFYLVNLIKQGNPFVLGYSVNSGSQTRTDLKVPNTLKPTGTAFTVYHDPQHPEVSNLSFVLVTQGGHGRINGTPGNLTSNWIKPGDLCDGKIIYSHASLFESLLLQPLFDKIRTDVWQRISSRVSVPEGNNYSVAKRVTPDHWELTISNINSGDNRYVNSFSVNIDNKAGAIAFYFKGQIYAYKEVSKSYFFCTATGHASGSVDWSGMIVVRTIRNAEGNSVITLDNNFQIDRCSTSSGQNDCADGFQWIGTILGAIVDSFTAFRDGGFFSDLLASVFSVGVAGIGNLSVTLQNVSADVSNIIVLPAGELFDFKNASADYDGNISLQLTYKNA